MSRLKKLKVEEENAMIQKTVRIPSELYKDVELLMIEANIDSFNRAVVELLRLEVKEWKDEKEKEVKKESKIETKKTRKKNPKNDSDDESKGESKGENKSE